MGFRVPVQMTKFFTDERSFSYVYVHEKFKSIRQLELYLIDTFSLEGELCLMKENYLLPSCESINIVKADEMITVSPLQSPFTFIDKAYSSNKEIPPLEEVTENVEKEAKKKKRKKNKESTQEISTVDFDIDEKLPNKENVSLNCSSASPIKTKVLDNPEVFTAIKNIEEYHSKFKQKKSEEEEVEAMKSKALNALKDFFPTNVNGVSDGRIKKRKRIRIRKSKKSNQVEYLQSDSESTITQNNKSLVLTTGKINSHVRFTQSVEKPVTILQNEIVTQKNDKKPRIIRAIQPDIASINTTNGVKHFDKVTSSESAKNFFPDFISFSSSDKFNSHENVSQNGGSYPSLSNILKELDNYPIINNMSLESDAVIVFKMLKMGEDYAPIISDFILGKVISCDLDSQSIQLAILDGHEECITPSGKFELDQDDDDAKVDSLPVVIDVSWDQLLEPRLFHN